MHGSGLPVGDAVMRFKTIILWSVLGLAGCADAGNLCADIELGTPAEELPLSSVLTGPGDLGEIKGPTQALACCRRCDWGAGSGCDFCNSRYQVDCADPSFRATAFDVGGAYSGRCGTHDVPGDYACTAWVREDKVVGVAGFCLD